MPKKAELTVLSNSAMSTKSLPTNRASLWALMFGSEHACTMRAEASGGDGRSFGLISFSFAATGFSLALVDFVLGDASFNLLSYPSMAHF